MNLRCTLGSHQWKACKCLNCGKQRDQEHDWSRDCEKCACCGVRRVCTHTWEGCKCARCETTRDQDHDWTTNCEICRRCRRTRSGAHIWREFGGDITFVGDACEKCGVSRDHDPFYESLFRKLNDGRRSVAVKHLAACCTYRSIEALLAMWTDERVRPGLDRLGKHAPWDELIAVSNQGSEAVEAFVVASLLRRTDERAPALLESALRSSRPRVRIAALEVLAESSDPKVLPRVISALDDSSESVRAWVVAKLAKNAGQACAQQILSRIHDPHAMVRAAVARAIGVIRPANRLELLIQMRRDTVWKVYSAAEDTLRHLIEARAVPFLVCQVCNGSGKVGGSSWSRECQNCFSGVILGNDIELASRQLCRKCFGMGRRVLRGDGPGHRPVFADEYCEQCGGNGIIRANSSARRITGDG